ncbi:MAG TPA: ATP-binding protein [Pyrinomonadaceae bacterium]|nr:ATP-binding protein [Pyrinomonadaceae bacterium]
MKPRKPTGQSRISPWILGSFVLISLTVLILLQTSNLWKDFTVETASDTLLLYALSSLNFIAFVIFGFIFLRSITKLMRERRTLQLGSKIKSRLLLYFAAVSILPIVAMAGFSYLFMNRALERWFTQFPEKVVLEARDAQKLALADQNRRLKESVEMLALAFNGREISQGELDGIAQAGNLSRIELVDSGNRLIVASEGEVSAAERQQLDSIILNARSGTTEGSSFEDGKGYDAAVASLQDGRRLLIVPGVRADPGVIEKAESWLLEFDSLKKKQITVRQIGLLTLGVLTFLLIFASTWIAFYIARGLTVPIKALAEGADEIARGNLAHRVDVLAEDELALLVAAFNQMSSRLEENSAELRNRRRYIETVLQSLPTGVISFDSENRVGTINRAALSILALDETSPVGNSLSSIVTEENRTILERVVARAKRVGSASEQTVLHSETGELAVALTATALTVESGAVLVIEDLSELIAAQRASAWQEVARRMAHEIKNPLTPIQLAAERIAKRFAGSGRLSLVSGRLGSFAGEDQMQNVVEEGTATIIREVQSLKSMVDEFTRFARLPNANPEPGDLNDVIDQVLALYKDRLDGVRIESSLGQDLPYAMIDTEQLKRVFVNLIDNAIEAFDESNDEKVITITSRYDLARDLVVSEISDNGRGIAAADLQKLFQPYFSTKGRGTGLGLAIVHRIITEHNGKIKAVANQPYGARFIVELPVVDKI